MWEQYDDDGIWFGSDEDELARREADDIRIADELYYQGEPTHEHTWDYQTSRFAGTPSRYCTTCKMRELYWEDEAYDEPETPAPFDD